MQPRQPAPVHTISAHLLGEWRGQLPAGLHLRLDIHTDQTIVTSLDQGNAQFLGEIVTDGSAVVINFPRIDARFVGEWRPSNRTLVGAWEQRGRAAPLIWHTPDNNLNASLSSNPPLSFAAVDQLRMDAQTPALVAATVAGNQPPLIFATGNRSAAQPSPVTPEDVWHIGSITKSMTSTLVGRLVDLGVVSWGTTITEVLGKAIPDIRPEYRSLTLLHLLSHRSGLQANLPAEAFGRFTRELKDARKERLEWARQALHSTPACEATKAFLYSNSGYIVAGAMVESVLKTSWETALKEHVCVPLGMHSVGFGAPGSKGNLVQPVGHTDEGVLKPHLPGDPSSDNPAALGPAGRVHISIADLLLYLAAHRDHHPLLRKETWEALHQPHFGGDYALGWVQKPLGLWHNGSNTLWHAEVCIGKDGRLAVAAANCATPAAVTAVSAALVLALRAPLAS